MILVGHNPSLAILALNYCGYKDKLDMGYVIRIDFNCDSWIDVSKNNAEFKKVYKIGK